MSKFEQNASSSNGDIDPGAVESLSSCHFIQLHIQN